jgi:probable H4MPT-linked C1 transfer pathway protein
MPTSILGLDIGGANLKAAAPDKRAISVPFPLWKQPDRLPAALAELVTRFPDAEELAVTMTGELCDCFETKRDGVNAIIAAVRFASGGRRIRVWSTDGLFLNDNDAKANHLKVASANWHALATLAGQYAPTGRVILIDIGSTTTDIIPILDGVPVPQGKTDYERLESGELVYTGVRRTPVCAIPDFKGAAEFFATTLDVYLTLGLLLEASDDCDTADGRPATKVYARTRLARMIGGDAETIPAERIEALATELVTLQFFPIERSLDRIKERLALMPTSAPWEPSDRHMRVLMDMNPELKLHVAKQRITVLVSGSGEFLTRRFKVEALSLGEKLGPAVSACAPAYAVAVLAAESR